MEFLQGQARLSLHGLGHPTYNVKGWKGPCYLITDGHYKTFEDLMTKTPVGKLRRRQRSALRPLHGALRV